MPKNLPRSTDLADRMQRVLRRTFKLKRLRGAQTPVIDRVLRGLSTMAILPTGAGKSLCYQLPALLLPGRTLVVSPLIALMKDQCDALVERGVPAVAWHSGLGAADAATALGKVEDGTARIVFVTPEKLGGEEGLALLARHPVSLLVVDEAHCLSQWGFDFRPAYLDIGAAAERLGDPPILALTATATPEVVDDVTRLLSIPRAGVVGTESYRANLHYRAEPFSRSEDKLARLLEVVRSAEGSGLVYAATVKSAEALHDALVGAGEPAGLYHGRMGAGARSRAQDDFMAGRTRVMVATNAFGMGVDKPDIRFVVHHELPADLSAYCQETGRAGRDGLPATCTLLFVDGDRRVQRFFLSGRYPGVDELRRVVDAVRQAPDGVPADEVADRCGAGRKAAVARRLVLDAAMVVEDEDGRLRAGPAVASRDALQAMAEACRARAERDDAGLEAMVAYAQSGRCRWRLLLEHLEARPSRMQCGACDNCLRLAAHERIELPPPAEQIVVPAPAFHVGDRVRTRRHGSADVVACDSTSVTVRFDNGETRSFQPEFVAAVAARRRSPASLGTSPAPG